MTTEDTEEDDLLLGYLNSVSSQVIALLDLDGRLGSARVSPSGKQRCSDSSGKKPATTGSNKTPSSMKQSHQQQQTTKRAKKSANEKLSRGSKLSSAGRAGGYKARVVEHGTANRSLRARGRQAALLASNKKELALDDEKAEPLDHEQQQRHYHHQTSQPHLQELLEPHDRSQQHLSTCNNAPSQQLQQLNQHAYAGDQQSHNQALSHITVAAEPAIQIDGTISSFNGVLTLTSLDDELAHQLGDGHSAGQDQLSPLGDHHHSTAISAQLHHSAANNYYSTSHSSSVYDDLLTISHHNHHHSAQQHFDSHDSDTYQQQQQDNHHHHTSMGNQNNHIQLLMQPMHPQDCYHEQQQQQQQQQQQPNQHQSPSSPIIVHQHHQYQQHQQASGASNEQPSQQQQWLNPLLGGHDPTANISSDGHQGHHLATLSSLHHQHQQASQQGHHNEPMCGYQSQVYQQPSYYGHNEHAFQAPIFGMASQQQCHQQPLTADNSNSNKIQGEAGVADPTRPPTTSVDSPSYHLHNLGQQHMLEHNHQHHTHHHHDHDHHNQHQQHMGMLHNHHHHHHLLGNGQLMPGNGLVNGMVEPSSVILQDINLASASWSSSEDLYSI